MLGLYGDKCLQVGVRNHLNEIMAAMNVPRMSKKNYKDRKSNWNIMGKYFSRGDNKRW